MPDMLQQFVQETIDLMLKQLPLEKRLEGVPPEKLLEHLSTEQIVEHLSAEKRRQLQEALNKKSKGNGSSNQPE